jgi:hypothetical protein
VLGRGCFAGLVFTVLVFGVLVFGVLVFAVLVARALAVLFRGRLADIREAAAVASRFVVMGQTFEPDRVVVKRAAFITRRGPKIATLAWIAASHGDGDGG